MPQYEPHFPGSEFRSANRYRVIAVVMSASRVTVALAASIEPSICSLGAWPFTGEPRGSCAAQSLAGIRIYVPGSNGPGSEKPSIDSTFAWFSAMLSGVRCGS